ncbi:MAG TPA: RNA chaperone Hfq [Acidobacteriaceae bacterium]|nr:RNA chaperone Hfq [Acidobacteriaceae bacterium]
MPNSSHIPAAGLPDYRSETPPKPTPSALQPVSPVRNTATNGVHESTSLPVTGPRKLVRPTLPTRSFRSRTYSPNEDPPILAHQNMAAHAAASETTHAEAFYFQKQVQTQTPLMIVLEGGDRIEGCIEWYDRYSIKVRSASRILIYKSAIKYIYKIGEQQS